MANLVRSVKMDIMRIFIILLLLNSLEPLVFLVEISMLDAVLA